MLATGTSDVLTLAQAAAEGRLNTAFINIVAIATKLAICTL